ncbi:MAG: acyl-CoA/acyl-ACP dehydrogenase [Chloroflexi bacterium]|nr:acyl-CoA/acyl-ACP dehydrogenase [Chloroflexota bacterium]
MDLGLSEQQEMLHRTTREFLERECPTALVRAMEQDEGGYPPTLWRGVAELGWPGILFPDENGGLGLGYVDAGVLFQEIGRAMAPIPLFQTVALGGVPILEAGNTTQRRKYLNSIAAGDLIATMALVEPEGTFGPDGIKLEARQSPRGFVLSGTKMFVEFANVADLMVVAARTSPAGRSRTGQGVSLFLVDARSPGISQTPLKTIAADKQSEVVFRNVEVPADSLLGPVNEGWPVVEHTLQRATLLTCAQMVGAARRVLEITLDYAKSRLAFGRPIGSFQAIQHMCADMVTWADGAELLTYEALWKVDEGLPAAQAVSMAKGFCNERLRQLTAHAQQIHGGIGYMLEFDLQLWFRRMKGWELKLGNSFLHREHTAGVLLGA